VKGGSVANEGATDDPIERLAGYTPEIWALSVAFYGVGDLLTTLIGLYGGRATEAGVVAAALVEGYGIAAVVPLKLGSLLLFYLLWRVAPRPHAVGVPLGLAALGGALTAWNAFVLLGAPLP
jgi:hypothetical protein